MATCPPGYEWADNVQNMDPCAVASSLMGACGLPPLDPISPGDDYPRLQSSCTCSSVVYALVSACSDCQSGEFDNWSQWSAGCTRSFVSSLPPFLPPDVSVPQWAYFNVSLDPRYSPYAASSSAAAASAASTSAAALTTPTSTNAVITIPAAQPVQTSIITSSTSEGTIVPTSIALFQTTSTDTSTLSEPSFISTMTNSFGSDSSRQSSAGNRTAAIAGGTVGALLFLVIGAALAYWWLKRRRRRRIAPSTAYMAVHGLESHPKLIGTEDY